MSTYDEKADTEVEDTMKEVLLVSDQQKQNENKSKLSILLWHDFDKKEFPIQLWRVKDLLLGSGFTLVAAPSGGKKSWFCLEMARCVKLGIPFLGYFETVKSNVLYIEQETSQSLLQLRGRQLGINEVNEGFWILSQDCLSLNDDAVTKELFSFMNSNDVGVVFIDTIRSVAGGLKEEKAEEVRAFFNRFKPWKDKGISVVFVDHTRKPAPYESKDIPKKEQILGSQDKVAAVETVLMLKSEERSSEIIVHQVKNKGGVELNPFKVSMNDTEDNGIKKTFLKYSGSVEEKVLRIDQAKELIKGFLFEQKTEQGAKNIQEALAGKTGKTNTETALKEMREKNEICFRQHGSKYFYWYSTEDEHGDKDAEGTAQQDLYGNQAS